MHQLIFALPVLKYCNISFESSSPLNFMSNSPDKMSRIEHFISKSKYGVNDFDCLLSSMPQLVRLSCQLSSVTHSELAREITLTSLRHFSLDHSIPFDEFEIYIKRFFHQLRVLRILSVFEKEYLDSNRWERLISNHMPCLHTFHFQYLKSGFNKDFQGDDEYHMLFNGFTSSFWIKRHWIFSHQHYYDNNNVWTLFYSIYSHRYASNEDNTIIPTCSLGKVPLDLARHIIIENNKTSIDYSFDHSRSKQLTLSGNLNYKDYDLFVNELNRMIPLRQITNLNVTRTYSNRNLLKKVLDLSPNIKILTFYGQCLCSLSQQNGLTILNNIEQIIIRDQLTLDNVRSLLEIFPDIQSLEMNIREDDLEYIIRYLFKFKINKNHRLCLLGLRDSHPVILNRLQKVIQREQLFNTYSIQYIHDTMYLWC
jgi:hypothetical protein